MNVATLLAKGPNVLRLHQKRITGVVSLHISPQFTGLPSGQYFIIYTITRDTSGNMIMMLRPGCSVFHVLAIFVSKAFELALVTDAICRVALISQYLQKQYKHERVLVLCLIRTMRLCQQVGKAPMYR